MIWRFIDKLRYRLIGIRKILFSMILLAVTSLMVLFNLLKSEDFATIWAATGPALMVANLGEYLVKRYTTPKKEPEA